ncbi:MAG TPA: Ig-like domain-containing protein [Gaiellaceae bacterium]|nr:Ig-like domain-containing protein [Gaiellaceae bacterium]
MRSSLVLAVLVFLLAHVGAGSAVPPTELFLSEYIEGTSNNKALEIFNGTGSSVDLTAGGYNVQMFFNGSPSAGLTINLTGTVMDGDVFVLAQSSADPAILAQADQTNGSGWFNGDDAVVLRKGTTLLDVIGQIGFDPGTEWGVSLASTADNTLRRKASVVAGDPDGSNAFDPAVEWDGFATNSFDALGCHPEAPCPTPEAAPSVDSTSPTNGAADVAVGTNVALTFGEPVNVAGSWFDITCAASGQHSATVSGGPTTFTLDPDDDFAAGETCTVTVVASQVTDQDADDPPDNMAADFVFSFTTVLAITPIHDIQGAAHLSPKSGTPLKTQGIVTATRSNGYFVQDPSPDADDSTSEAIFVFTSVAPAVAVGDEVQVVGNITEFRPGGSASTNLTTTEITSPATTVLSSGNPLPAATVIGNGGRMPPSTVIEDDATGSVETSGVFDPLTDGIDFYESLEAMRVQLNDAVAVGPRSDFGEIAVVGDNGANASVRTPRGGIVVRAGDFNPERIILDDVIAVTPAVDTGDTFGAPLAGVLDYSFGNFKLLVTTSPTVVPGGLTRETVPGPGVGELSIATFNVENLDPTDPPSKFADLAGLIVNNLGSPDLLSLEEVQDNNGPTNDAVVDASATFDQLIAAVQAAGGPAYQFRQINPLDDQDGGEPGGNIRVGFLFRTDRGLQFVDRPGGDATTATTIVSNGGIPELSISPGRVDPGNTAWSFPEGVRKPLAGEFVYDGRPLFVIANHWKSKGGDDPLFGRFQPPTLVTEAQRTAEAQVVNDFVDAILAVDPNAAVVVLGDLNDFDFSTPLATVEGGVLTSLVETLPQAQRYSFVFDGNAQALDHILVSGVLAGDVSLFDIAHVNAEFAVQASDHDPLVAQICADATAPSLSVSLAPNVLFPPNHKYVAVSASVNVSDSVDPSPSLTLVSVKSNEPDNAPGDADGNTVNDIRVDGQKNFRLRAERSETGTGRVYTVTYTASDACGNTTTSSATVTVPLRS